jgi:hypothetical protein
MKSLLNVGTLLSLTFALGITACGHKEKSGSKYPANFNSIGDAGRVDYMIAHTTPDSVARFIIQSALGKNPDARIDTLAIATNHAYEKLSGNDLDSFSIAYDGLVESLPLADKMKAYMLGGSEDPQGLGYKLGLEYMANIRNENKTADDVEKELKAFEKACGNDTAMYRRFMIGFRTVLEVDHGKDVPEEIYRRFAK